MADEEKQPEVIPIKPIGGTTSGTREQLYNAPTEQQNEAQQILSSMYKDSSTTAFLPKRYKVFLVLFVILIVVGALAAGIWLFKGEFTQR